MHAPTQITTVYTLPGLSSHACACIYIFNKTGSHYTHFSTICFSQSLTDLHGGQTSRLGRTAPEGEAGQVVCTWRERALPRPIP